MFSFFKKNKSSQDQLIANYLKDLLGIRSRNLVLYRLALIHRSASNNTPLGIINNERLEYLGDAIVGAVIAEYLFKKYPLKFEGELTEMRSKLVNRERLSALAKRIRLNELIVMEPHSHSKSVEGDAFEAFVGALFLDKGYEKAKHIILNKIFLANLDIDLIFLEESNYKSKIINWGQKHRKKITFHHTEMPKDRSQKLYKAELLIDDKPFAEGMHYTIKKAEKLASENACHQIFGE